MASALIDTNLLLLLVVGMTNKKYISKHKRTKMFTERCYDEFLELLENFDSLWITSHCLAETSNLLKHTGKHQAQELLSTLSGICLKHSEPHIIRDDIFNSKHYLRLGVADTGFVLKSKEVTHSFTVDHDLYGAISALGREITNFTHIQTTYFL